MKLISVCIPTYEMRGLGALFLSQSFDILAKQTLKDFNVVVSDHSKTPVIQDVCEAYKDRLDIHYYKNTENIGNSSANTNNAIRKADGKLIKILFQDDFLYSSTSLEDIANSFNLSKDRWLVTASEHTIDGVHFYRPFYPKYNETIHFGKNTISSPSVLTIKNDNPILFDENLVWLMDCDYYKRCHDMFGEPKILNTINVVNRVGRHQVSNTVATYALKNKEYLYIANKYPGRKSIKHRILFYVARLIARFLRLAEKRLS